MCHHRAEREPEVNPRLVGGNECPLAKPAVAAAKSWSPTRPSLSPSSVFAATRASTRRRLRGWVCTSTTHPYNPSPSRTPPAPSIRSSFGPCSSPLATPVLPGGPPRGTGSYQFSLLGDSEANVWDLFKVLYNRIPPRASRPPRPRGELGWQITDAHPLVGRICWDPDRAGEIPLIVVDGRPYTWDEVGRMLMSFEGFTLRAEIEDSIEVIGGPLLDEDEPTTDGQ